MLKDTTPEIEALQNELWMKRTPQARTRAASEMFAAARHILIKSLPEGLSDDELRRRVYERTYAEPFPEDFLPTKRS